MATHTFPLANLPRELRNEVYEHLFAGTVISVAYNSIQCPGLPIFLTSRQCHKEAKSAYYRVVTWHLHSHPWFVESFDQWFRGSSLRGTNYWTLRHVILGIKEFSGNHFAPLAIWPKLETLTVMFASIQRLETDDFGQLVLWRGGGKYILRDSFGRVDAWEDHLLEQVSMELDTLHNGTFEHFHKFVEGDRVAVVQLWRSQLEFRVAASRIAGSRCKLHVRLAVRYCNPVRDLVSLCSPFTHFTS